MKNNLGNLVDVFYQLAQNYGDDIPVCINVLHGDNVALKNVHLDLTDGEPLVMLEVDLEDQKAVATDFTISGFSIDNNSHNANPKDFLWDLDKVYDLLTIGKEEFLKSYLYVSEEEYDLTLQAIKPKDDKVEGNEEQISNMADLCRNAENLYIEELNNRSTDWNVTGSSLKDAIYNYIVDYYTNEQRDLFEDYCYNMGI